jgi:hypothetical protein
VRAEDFQILDQAFGYRPQPLHRFPFVSSYGPLNFALANNAHATGGFARSPLEERPPLRGGASSYPAFLVQGLPPADLAFVYPPHLKLFNDGYSIGWRWIREHPGDFVRLAAKKLAIFWAGAASGLTGWNLPTGISGRRRAVDMVSPDPDAPALAWQAAILAACGVGLISGFRRTAIVPWVLYFATKLVVTVFFFGYARTGATAVPVVALLLGIAGERWLRFRTPRRAVAVVLLSAVTLEAARFVRKPAVSIDGRPIGDADRLPPQDPVEHRIAVSVLRK